MRHALTAVTLLCCGIVQAQSARSPEMALDGLETVDDLETQLIAAEPLLLSPSSIDVDHYGRVWVCEVVNYRRFANQDRQDREDGDRILVLQDTDADGTLDHSTTFYQGRDINSAHGICVLGSRVIVSALDRVFSLYDDDGDLQADRRELMFTGIQGVQHDHGIHSFTFGPDGRLYFNFGNEGKELHTPDGSIVVDQAGNQIRDTVRPYQQGMVFRCETDGSNVETLAWNFRNNWELAVDSFGTIWQSDNDDDGNRATRINYVMEYGNYGFRDEGTGAHWSQPRTGMEKEISQRHWHLNDPGVVPNVLITGAGAPCGIAVYEADLLPERFHNQLVHCDAGVNVVRSYVVTPDGAGYSGSIEPVLSGTRDRWFRPCDVSIAADGSLIVADWYDPGVGGHRQGDVDRGRLFRIAPPNTPWQHPSFDLSTLDGAIDALLSCNRDARYLGWQKLAQAGADAEERLLRLFRESDNPRYRARALWLLGRREGRTQQILRHAVRDADPDIRIVSIRLARRMQTRVAETIRELFSDPSVAVRRECILALTDLPAENRPSLWAALALKLPNHDRWYLEALGIAARGVWDQCLSKLGSISAVPEEVRDAVIWRSRGTRTPDLIVDNIRAIADSNNPAARAHLAAWFRALDFQDRERVDNAVRPLMQHALLDRLSPDLRQMIATEALLRVRGLDSDPEATAAFNAALRNVSDLQMITLVERFRAASRYGDILKLVLDHPNQQQGITAVQSLLRLGQRTLLTDQLLGDSVDPAIAVATAMGYSRDYAFAADLQAVIDDEEANPDLRRAVVPAGFRILGLGRRMVRSIEANQFSSELLPAAAAAMHASSEEEFREAAQRLFPLPEGKEGEELPPLSVLLTMKGDAKNGRLVFNTHGTCHKCHIVNAVGRSLGPDLSEIGAKLSRQALFESVLFPSAGISHNYDTWTLLLTNGTTVTGLLASETNDDITLIDNEALRRTYPLAEVEEKLRQSVSLMPADLQKVISTQDLVDLVAYMQTLKKKLDP